MDSIGDLQFVVGGETVDLEVFLDESDDGLYYVVDIQRGCFDKIFAVLKSVKTSSGGIEEDERNRLFPDSDNSDAVMARVVVGSGDGEILDDQKVNFKPRAYLKVKIPMIIEKVSSLIKEVFDKNPDVEDVTVKVAVDGERIVTGFEGMVIDEDTGEF